MASETSPHPKKDDLMAFGLGKMSPEDAVAIEIHLAECPDCCDTMLELQDDTFVGLVKKSPPLPILDETDADGSVHDRSSHTAFQPTVLDSDTETKPLPFEGDATDLPEGLCQHSRYRILKRIGRGGMGDVYKAEHRVMNRHVALKVIKPELVRNESAIRRFHREVQAAARLHHGNIVTAHDAERAGSSHFLVMEFVDGINLDQVLRERGPLEVAQACDMVRQTSIGLEHAHQLGMVHRDIKPHNLMLTESGAVKILDFGLASFVSHAATEEADSIRDDENLTAPTAEILHQLTQIGTMMGTPDYIAPEQAKDARGADVRADIYSLGCTFYTLLTGKPPFQEDSVAKKLTAHAQKDPEPISKYRDDMPTEIDTVLKKMMAKDPAERYQTPAEVAEALDQFCKTATPINTTSSWNLSTMLAGVFATLMAFAVYYVQTDYGVVRVSVANKDVLVELNGESITMKDGEKELKIRAGRQKLFVKRGEFSFYTDNFQLGRGDDVQFKVELLPGEVSIRKDGERFGANPLPKTEHALLSKESVKELVAEATGIANEDWVKIATATELPTPSSMDNQSLSLILFSMAEIEPQEFASKAPDFSRDFHYLTPNIPKPAEIAKAIWISKSKGYASFIQPEYVTDATVNIANDSAHGSVSFKATGLYEGRVNYVARQTESHWRIEELHLPNSGLSLQRSDGGEWKRASSVNAEAVVTYTVTSRGPTFNLNGQPLSDRQELFEQLRNLVEENPHLVVQLKGDLKPDSLDVGQLQNLITGAGVQQVRFPPGFREARADAMAKAFMPSEQSDRMRNLAIIGKAFRSFDRNRGHLPPAQVKGGFDEEGRPRLSWRVHLLPFHGENALYEEFHLDEPWDSEHNFALLDEMPDVYQTTADPTKTTFLAVVGPGTFYEGKSGLKMADIHDGLSNTALVVDAGREKAVPWTKPEDIPFEPSDPIRNFGSPPFLNQFLVLLADGSTKAIPTNIAPDSLRALFTRAAGDKFDETAERAKPLAESAETSIRLVLSSKDDQPLLEIPGVLSTNGWQKLFDYLKSEVEKNPQLEVVLDISDEIDLNSGLHAEWFRGLPESVAAAGVKVKLSPRIVKLRQSQQGSARRRLDRTNDLKMIGLGLRNYESVYDSFPPAKTFAKHFDKNGQPYLSWRVHILPYIEQEELYNQFRLDEPWDSEHNRTLLDQMPDLFQTTAGATETTLMAVVGQGTAYEGRAGLSSQDITDNSANTAIVVDAGLDKSVPWTKPQDLPFDTEDPIRVFGTSDLGGTFLTLMVNGSVKPISYDTAPEQLRNLFLRADGHELDLEKKRATPLPDSASVGGPSSKNNEVIIGYQKKNGTVTHYVNGEKVTSSEMFKQIKALVDQDPKLIVRLEGSIELNDPQSSQVINRIMLAGVNVKNIRLNEAAVRNVVEVIGRSREEAWRKQETPLPQLPDNEVSQIRKFEGHTNFVKSVDFSPDGKLIASASGFPRGDNSVRIWDRASGKVLYRLDRHFIPVVFVTFSPDGKRLLSGDIHGRIMLWSAVGKIDDYKSRIAEWTNEKIMIDHAVFTPDGSRIVYLKVNPHAADAAIKNVSEFPRETQTPEALKGLKNQALSLIKRTIEVRDATNGKLVNSIPLKVGEAAMSGLTITPDSKHVAVPMYDGTVRLISLETEMEVRSYEPPETETPQKFALTVAISPDVGKLAAGYPGHRVRVWSLKTGETLKDIRTANQGTNHLVFFSDNRLLAACGPVPKVESNPPAACVVDTENGEIIAETSAILGDGLAFALAPDETHILTAGGGYFDSKSLKWEGTDDYSLKLWKLPNFTLQAGEID